MFESNIPVPGEAKVLFANSNGALLCVTEGKCKATVKNAHKIPCMFQEPKHLSRNGNQGLYRLYIIKHKDQH